MSVEGLPGGPGVVGVGAVPERVVSTACDEDVELSGYLRVDGRSGGVEKLSAEGFPCSQLDCWVVSLQIGNYLFEA